MKKGMFLSVTVF